MNPKEKYFERICKSFKGQKRKKTKQKPFVSAYGWNGVVARNPFSKNVRAPTTRTERRSTTIDQIVRGRLA